MRPEEDDFEDDEDDSEEESSGKPTLELVGQDGNAYVILDLAKRASQKAKWAEAQWNEFHTKATSGNYDNLLVTCMTYFDVR